MLSNAFRVLQKIQNRMGCNMEVLQLFDFAENPLAFAILQKSRSLIVRHLGKAVFEQNRDFSEESNLCNTSVQLVSKWFDEATILGLGQLIESATEAHNRHPNF
jgi:hypothetical protein